MAELTISDEAIRDIYDLLEYAQEYSEARGERLYNSIHESFSLLQEYPETGRSRADLAEGIRSLVNVPFNVTIFYTYAGDVVDVLRVLSNRQNIEGLL